MHHRSLLFVSLALAAVAAGCTSSGAEPDGSNDATHFAAQMGSVDHWAGAPQRVQIGIFASGPEGVRVVAQGSIDVSFAYLGADGGDAPAPGPTATATFVPVPGSETSGSRPTLTAGTRGVYEAEDVVFDRAGIWQASLHAEIDGVARELRATPFPVTEEPAIPAPGQRAPRTENLTMRSKGVSGASIDSMAESGQGIPDPELHRWTIADAIRQGRPALVLFGTPAHCESQFCGPEVQELQRLAAEHPDRAVFIHVEIWKDYNAQIVNKAAADWLLLPSGDLVEPWLFLIGADGRIAERWGPLFDTGEVESALEALPPMKP